MANPRPRPQVIRLTDAAAERIKYVMANAASEVIGVRAGIYADGVMFAPLHQGVIYLKADAETKAAFDREGMAPFSYATREGTRALASYRRLPDRLYDDQEALANWARDALSVARRRPKP